MKIGIIDVDGHGKYPNLALMKISAIEFRDKDVHDLSEIQIKSLIARYDPNVKYKRITGKLFKVCR